MDIWIASNFWLLWNNTTMNICIQVLVWMLNFQFSWVYGLRVVIWLISLFEETAQLFSKVASLIPQNEGSSFSTSSPILGLVRLVDYSYSNGCVGISFWFYLHCPNDKWCWTPLHVFINHHMSCWVKFLFQSFVYF